MLSGESVQILELTVHISYVLWIITAHFVFSSNFFLCWKYKNSDTLL